MKLDLAGYLEDDGLELPGIPSRAHPDGKTYYVASPDAKTGLRLAAMAEAITAAERGGNVDQRTRDALELDDDGEKDLYRKVLGDTYDEMVDDGVSWVRIQRLGQYLFLHFAMGEQVAANALKAGVLSGEAQGPNRAARRAPKATAKSTRSRASTSGTTSRPRGSKKA